MIGTRTVGGITLHDTYVEQVRRRSGAMCSTSTGIKLLSVGNKKVTIMDIQYENIDGLQRSNSTDNKC